MKFSTQNQTIKYSGSEPETDHFVGQQLEEAVRKLLRTRGLALRQMHEMTNAGLESKARRLISITGIQVHEEHQEALLCHRPATLRPGF